MTLAAHAGAVFAGCFRNAAAVAARARAVAGDRPIAVVAAGERWPDGALRPALEDDLGAGAIVAAIGLDRASPEARAAARLFTTGRAAVADLVRDCVSGRELVTAGYSDDVAWAVRLDASTAAPERQRDGFLAATPA